uniref:m7GpppX diphosphatase n=1 Tax=Schistocephalus solidus TaxID=70667 RepID=A0A0V0J7L7_SCHSO
MDDGKFHSDKVRDSCSKACSYKPTNMHIVKILLNDQLGKLICLHAKFKDSLDEDAIVILQKTPFPNKVQALCEAHLGRPFSECEELEEWEMRNGSKASLVFPEWKADRVTDNDIYHRRLVKAGLEDLNTLNMTVIHPAGPHHFVKYTASGRRLVLETPELYADVVVPFLEARPPDLAWVDNVLNGTAEVDRVLFADPDKSLGFVLAIDFRWDLRQLNELHCLVLARSASLTCLRDLRAYHLPMMKKMLSEGRRALVAKYGGGAHEKIVNDRTEGETVVAPTALSEDQIFAYFHYPPTFYRLHMHFAHVDSAPDGGTQTGKAYLVEDVIANLEQDGEFYARRTMPMFLHENHAFLAAIRESASSNELETAPEAKEGNP